MIVYLDTSALVKRYLVEADSPTIEALWNKTTRAVASEILYAEMAATFARKKREVPADADSIERARTTFRAEWLSMRRVAVNDDVHARVDQLLARHALRAADATHLASALLVRDAFNQPITFACADQKLVAAARAEELDVEPKPRLARASRATCAARTNARHAPQPPHLQVARATTRRLGRAEASALHFAFAASHEHVHNGPDIQNPRRARNAHRRCGSLGSSPESQFECPCARSFLNCLAPPWRPTR